MNEQRMGDLERRLQLTEDRLEILNLIASYGPLVDSGDATATAALWIEGGCYDVDTGRYEGHTGIADMVNSRPHQGLIARGCAHLTTPPRIELEGDRAIATTHSQLLLHRADGGFDVLRATAHRWELVRTPAGWRIQQRTSRLLDGSESGPDLLRRAQAQAPTTDA